MKLLMSQLEYDEAIQKAKEEERSKVIFCRDCAHRRTNHCPLYTVLVTTEDDFCSWAYRRERE